MAGAHQLQQCGKGHRFHSGHGRPCIKAAEQFDHPGAEYSLVRWEHPRVAQQHIPIPFQHKLGKRMGLCHGNDKRVFEKRLGYEHRGQLQCGGRCHGHVQRPADDTTYEVFVKPFKQRHSNARPDGRQRQNGFGNQLCRGAQVGANLHAAELRVQEGVHVSFQRLVLLGDCQAVRAKCLPEFGGFQPPGSADKKRRTHFQFQRLEAFAQSRLRYSQLDTRLVEAAVEVDFFKIIQSLGDH